jgi:hypothetical protein
MYYTVPLFDSNKPNVRTPSWWRNFVRSNPSGERFNREVINDRLLEYSGSYSVAHHAMSGVHRHLDFYDEKAYTWFVLRWS